MTKEKNIINTKAKIEIKVKVKIDTIQLHTTQDNINYEELERFEGYNEANGCIKSTPLKNNRISLIIHPSRFQARYKEYTGYKAYRQIIDYILDRIVYDKSILKIRRCDLCYDTTQEFQELLQIHYSLVECVNVEFKVEDDGIKFDNLKDYKTSNFITRDKEKNKTFELSIYDKKKESKGNHMFNTRCEFRQFFSNKNYYNGVEIEVITKLLNLLDRFKDKSNYDIAIKKVTQKLLSEAMEENNFTSFIKHYKTYLFDNGIVRELYKLKGKTDAQANKIITVNKKLHNLNSIKYTEFKKYMNILKEEINKFVNG